MREKGLFFRLGQVPEPLSGGETHPSRLTRSSAEAGRHRSERRRRRPEGAASAVGGRVHHLLVPERHPCSGSSGGR